jgi:hypothetical protein
MIHLDVVITAFGILGLFVQSFGSKLEMNRISVALKSSACFMGGVSCTIWNATVGTACQSIILLWPMSTSPIDAFVIYEPFT